MTVTELIKAAQYVIDSEGNKQAVQLDIAQWEALLAWIATVEQNWAEPFEGVHRAWANSSPAPDEESLPHEAELVELVHQARRG